MPLVSRALEHVSSYLSNIPRWGIHSNAGSQTPMISTRQDGLAHESNYTSGLRIFDGWRLDQGRMREVGYFDGYPADDHTGFAGSWSNYPWFKDGKVVFTGTEEGLFVVQTRLKTAAPGR